MVSPILDVLTARNFEEFVCDAYTYLMNYHTDGARVYLFGFSRGAYVARALAGMIQKVGHRGCSKAYMEVGLLSPGNQNQVRTCVICPLASA